MSQNDFTIANQTFPNTRADINSALQALASTSSGTSAPSTTFANQLWYDTSANILYIRNEDNDGNIAIAELDQSNDTVEYFKSDSVRTALIEFTDGDDALAIADGGALTVSTSLDMNGTELILDADADTSITADTDDRIDIKVGNTDVAYITKNNIGGIINRMSAKPLIINGNMAVAQRGTSVTGVTGVGYNAIDRMKTLLGDNGTWTHTQDTDVPTGQGFANSWKLDNTTADTSVASGAFHTASYFFEGQDLQLLKKGTSSAEKVTISFWIKTTVTGTYVAELYDGDNTRHISQAYTVSSSNTWEKKVLSFAGDTTGALDDDNANSLILNLWLGAGSDYTSGTLATSWASVTTANRAVGQVNGASSTSNNIYITGLQMEVGEYTSTTLPPFQHESFGDNLLRCKRYYQQSYANGTAPATVTNDGAYMLYLGATGNTFRYNLNFETAMRASPTKTFYVPSTGTVGKAGYEGAGDTNAFTVLATFNTNKHALLYQTSVPATGHVYWHWTASSEL